MTSALALTILGAIIAAAVGYLCWLLRVPPGTHDEHEDMWQ